MNGIRFHLWVGDGCSFWSEFLNLKSCFGQLKMKMLVSGCQSFKILVSGFERGELIWDPVKIWIIRAGCSEECCQQFTWRGGAQFEVTGMYSRWLTAAILGAGKAFLVFGSTAIRKPVAEPLNSQTPIFHAEQVKSELCTSFWKS